MKLTRYAAGLPQRAHTHNLPHMSLVLAGGFQEEAGRTEVLFGAGQLALRPDGLRHGGVFTENGALIVTCMFAEHASALSEPRWSAPLPRERLRRLTPLLLGDAREALEAGWDLIALASDESERREPSAWIRGVRDQLIEEPGAAKLNDIAAHSGRHRVHLGRSFLAAFGETPSAFRRRAMLDRALCAMVKGASAAAAAADAGFADQSHFTRACRESFAMPPRQLAQRLARAHFVQTGTP